MIELRITTPPSVNHLFATVGKRRVKTRDYQRWIDMAGWECLAHRQRKVSGPYRVVIGVPRGVRGDIDNRIKPVLDLLVRQGLTDDDAACEDVRAHRIDGTLCVVNVEAVEASKQTSAGRVAAHSDALSNPEPCEKRDA
ncbi:MAG: RusA family crossover junction endodeoxyribonuclease [Pseudomonadota bacterium]